MRKRKLMFLFIFISPAAVIYSLFLVYPSIIGFYYGMTDWDGFSTSANFVGMDNFRRIINDSLVYTALKNTVLFTFFTVIAQNIIALFFSILLNQKLRGVVFFRAIYFFPVIISTVVICFVWSVIFNPVVGPWKPFFDFLGMERISNLNVLGNRDIALYAVMFVKTWQYIGFLLVIYLAGLQTIPKDLYEAANIDGANRRQKFTTVTFPLIAPALTINMILSTIGSLKQFDHVFIMTGGGPGYSTQVIGTAIYSIAFANNQYGYGIALSILLFLAVSIVSILQMKYLKKREVSH